MKIIADPTLPVDTVICFDEAAFEPVREEDGGIALVLREGYSPKSAAVIRGIGTETKR